LPAYFGAVPCVASNIASMERAIVSKRVTYDFARLMEGATQVSCSGFGDVMIEQMQ
jgi:isocitrate dehydrogenase